jgi:hypothetical protein
MSKHAAAHLVLRWRKSKWFQAGSAVQLGSQTVTHQQPHDSSRISSGGTSRLLAELAGLQVCMQLLLRSLIKQQARDLAAVPCVRERVIAYLRGSAVFKCNCLWAPPGMLTLLLSIATIGLLRPCQQEWHMQSLCSLLGSSVSTALLMIVYCCLKHTVAGELQHEVAHGIDQLSTRATKPFEAVLSIAQHQR